MLFIKESDVTIPETYHNSLWSHNSDGMGVWNFDSKELFKTLDKKEAFDYLTLNKDKRLMVHYRFGTSGDKSMSLVHPFDVGNGLILAHNGVLSTFRGKLDKSDTYQLAEMFKGVEASVEDMTLYLEKFERGSRFLIVDTNTNDVYMPKCAEWHCHKMDDGKEIKFSNTYAIGHHILWKGKYNNSYSDWDDYDYGGKGYNRISSTYNVPEVNLMDVVMGDDLEIGYDNLFEALVYNKKLPELERLILSNPTAAALLIADMYETLDVDGVKAVAEKGGIDWNKAANYEDV